MVVVGCDVLHWLYLLSNGGVFFVVGVVMDANWWADVLTGIGLFITLIGAGWAAKSVILSEDNAIRIGLPRYGGETREENLSMPHVQSLLQASKGARIGLWLVFGGTVLQLIPIMLRLIG